METTFKLTDAIALAEFAHRNQVDKAGLPYVEHPKRVLQAVQAQGALPYVQIAAILHDVCEDTPFDMHVLKKIGVPTASVDLIVKLSRKFHGGRQEKSDALYYEDIRKDPEALKIKLADINDNTQPWRLSYLSLSEQERLTEKYENAKVALGVES